MASQSSLGNIQRAHHKIKTYPLIQQIALEKHQKICHYFQARVYAKREDAQTGRSFKIRGAYNFIRQLTQQQRDQGLVGATDGNFGLALAFVCADFKIKLDLFVPHVISHFKIENILYVAKDWVTIHKLESIYVDVSIAAEQWASDNNKIFIHSYNNWQVIEGNATIALEILNDVVSDLDYVFIPVGGGSLAAGISEVFKQLSPETKLIGVESELAPAMSTSLAKGEIVKLEDISRFCDGSAVHRVGEICFSQLKKHLTKVITVPEGLISKTILKLYNLGIVAEPAGAMAIAGMEMLKSELVGKEIAVVISGSNTKLLRVDEFIEKALVYEGLKYMILVQMPNVPTSFQDFAQKCLQKSDQISQIQFSKKLNRESSPALIGIEVKQKSDFALICSKMTESGLKYELVNEKDSIYNLLN